MLTLTFCKTLKGPVGRFARETSSVVHLCAFMSSFSNTDLSMSRCHGHERVRSAFPDNSCVRAYRQANEEALENTGRVHLMMTNIKSIVHNTGVVNRGQRAILWPSREPITTFHRRFSLVAFPPAFPGSNVWQFDWIRHHACKPHNASLPASRMPIEDGNSHLIILRGSGHAQKGAS